MAAHCSILARRTPWTEEPGGLQSMESQRVGHDGAAKHITAEQTGSERPASRPRAQGPGVWAQAPVLSSPLSFSALAAAAAILRDRSPGTSPAPSEQRSVLCAECPSQPLLPAAVRGWLPSRAQPFSCFSAIREHPVYSLKDQGPPCLSLGATGRR